MTASMDKLELRRSVMISYLCRIRHSYDYADSAIMPTWSLVPGVLPGQSRRGPGRYSA